MCSTGNDSMSGTSITLAAGDHERRLTVCANDTHWQRVWLSVRDVPWRSLAVLSVDSALSTLDVVHGLAAVAWFQCGTSVVVADLRSAVLNVVSSVQDELRQRMQNGEQVLMALGALDDSPASLAIARDADKVLLCVALGKTKTGRIRDAVQRVGKQRFLGTVLVNPAAATR
jgi:hypothetical protein